MPYHRSVLMLSCLLAACDGSVDMGAPQSTLGDAAASSDVAADQLVVDSQSTPPAEGGTEAATSDEPDTATPACGVLPASTAEVGWLAFDSNLGSDNRDLYVMRSDRTQRRKITDSPANDQQPTFAPDGRQVAFASDREEGKTQVFILNLDTMTTTRLTNRPEGAQQPAWSPDGKLIAFGSGLSIFVVSPDGTGEKEILTGTASEPHGYYEYPTFSSDGAWIVADRCSSVAAIRVDGSETRSVVKQIPNTVEMPAMSISGTSSVLISTFCDQGIESIWRIPFMGVEGQACAAGSRLTPKDDVDAKNPAWGWNGLVAYERGDGSADLMLIDQSGGSPWSLTCDGADDRNPTWAPRDADLK